MATLPNPLPTLAADPSGRSLGLELPLGRLIDAADGPLLWHAAYSASPGAWAALGGRAGRTGLLPVLLDVGGSEGGPQEWELRPEEMSYPGDHDPEELLAEYWEYAVEEPDDLDETIEPYDETWPGTARGPESLPADPDTRAAESLPADPDTRAAESADALLGEGTWFKDPRLALVPARRTADIPAAIGWTGPVNYEGDTARLCAVLRSWEDRFGIRVVALTFDQLVVSVAAPPTTREEAEAVAAEHFAFCPDNITQGDDETLREYAEHQVLDQRVWSFWWD
ncbi:DUF4253 domain-containing protein [Streptomyces sp. SID13726]|uniref:DUF4253 domain-containing protein n=1 Tax=Streptomyces sp. SID13726 TaxID=2706058 RepID=UPI0013BDC184|nr:DUF4253 domain-containing protein [Streptomyces sp. SID13726]NEB00187.1 DUF4253 domain-containing protein [Streptomyces sp. SID13726]